MQAQPRGSAPGSGAPLAVRVGHGLGRAGTRVWRRARPGLVSTGAAGAVLTLAFAGGAISGRLEHRPSPHAPPAAPGPAATTSTPSTSASTTIPTTTPLQSAEVLRAKRELVEDMTYDLQSRHLDPDLARRAALAAAPAAVSRRHLLIALAWSPDRVPAIDAAYDRAVRVKAAERAPSVTDGAFVATAWGGLTVDGTTAQASLTGHYRLIEPANRAAGGTVEQPDQGWKISLRLTQGRWRMEDRAPPL